MAEQAADQDPLPTYSAHDVLFDYQQHLSAIQHCCNLRGEKIDEWRNEVIPGIEHYFEGIPSAGDMDVQWQILLALKRISQRVLRGETIQLVRRFALRLPLYNSYLLKLSLASPR